MKTAPFKVCTHCGARWETLEALLNDPELLLTGYQAHFDDLKGGLFYFTHHRPDCGTTLAIPAREFTSLSNRPILTKRGKEADGCPGYCARGNTDENCPKTHCECFWVREVMQAIHGYAKAN